MAKRKWADLAAWYFGDDNNEVERKIGAKWCRCGNPSFIDDNKYRRKERKFNDGEWYPVIDNHGERYIMVYREELNLFCPTLDDSDGDLREEFAFVGESLGKVDFGV